MKVFQINTVYNSRSTGRIAADIKHALEKEGHECFVAYGREQTDEDNTECVSNKMDLYCHAMLTRLTGKTGFYSKGATKKLIQRIEEFGPDIIHLHNIHGYYLHIEMLFDFLKKYNKPIVWTLHDCWPFTGHCAYFDMAACDKWKTECKNCPSLNDYPKSMVDNSNWNYKKKKAAFTGIENVTIVTPSKWLREVVKESYLGSHDVKVINNGIDTNAFKPTIGNARAKYNIGDRKIILGVASIWDRRKGLEDFLKLSEHIADDEVIVLVGLAQKQLENLPKNVIGIARTESREELAELYSAADVLFNPTYEDNYPTVNLEALACGTKVMTYRTGGSCESAFVDEKDAVDKGDFLGAYKKIKALRDQGVTIKPEQISLENMKQEYLELYRDIMNK